MKVYNSVEFLHVKNIKENKSKDIVVKHNKTISDFLPMFKKYNEQGYNIYKTFNTFFDDKRRTENINELRYIFIDLDYKNREKEDYISLRKRIKKLEKKYNIYPAEINETFSGYHILYPLDTTLYYIKNELYLELAEILIEYFNADKKAKQITGLYKLVNFLDIKEGRNFLIENKFLASKKELNEKSIKIETLKDFGIIKENATFKNVLKTKIYGLSLQWEKDGTINIDNYKEEKQLKLKQIFKNINKQSINKEIYEQIEAIDAKEWIEAINEYEEGELKGKNIIINGASIDNTSGLKLYFQDGKFNIKDFTDKNRYGNRLFLLNHVLGLSSAKSEKKKKKIFLTYINFIRERFGLSFNKSLKKYYISTKVIYDYLNGSIKIPNSIKKKIFEKYKIDINKDNESKYIDALINLYIKFEYIRQVKFNNEDRWQKDIHDLLKEDIGIFDNFVNRRNFKVLIELGNSIELEFHYYNKNKRLIDITKPIFKCRIINNQRTLSYVPIIGNKKDKTLEKKMILLNEEFASKTGLFRNQNLRLMMYFIYSVNKFKVLTFSINQIKKFLGKEKTSNEYISKKINKVLKELKSNGLIKYFSKNKSTYTISKTKFYNKQKKS